MSRVYDECLEKEAAQERVRMAKGERKCDRCGMLFSPEKPDQYLCSS